MVLKRLKFPQFFNGVARTFPTHKHGCRKRGKNLKISEKNVFLVASVKKTNFTTLVSPRKTFGKIH